MISRARPHDAPLSGHSMMAQRLELKYLIDRTTRTGLALDVARLMRPDPYAGPDGSYRVRSLYFDTPQHLCYHEKMAGQAVRHKLRVRAYGDDPSATPHVRLEVKARYLSFIQKTTVDVPRAQYPEIEEAIRNCRLPLSPALNAPGVSKEFFRLQRQYNMEPKILLQYRRTALERRDLSRARVNFDDELIANRDPDLLGSMAGARRLLQYGHCVFEIKVDGVLPFWLHALICKYDLQDQAFSKYCYAMRSECRMSAVSREEIGV